MPKNISTILINNSRQKVWDCITRPEFVKQWQYESELMTDWITGHKISFRSEWEGKYYEQWGTVLSYNPPESLSYSLFAPSPGLDDKPENYFIMHYKLTDEDGQTRLEIIQEDHRPHAVQEPPQGEENPVLRQLKALVEEI